MGRLQNDVQITRDALKQESQTLMKVRDQLQAQKSSMDNLNSNFGVIESIVKNLTHVLHRLGSLGDVSAPSITKPEVAITTEKPKPTTDRNSKTTTYATVSTE